MRSLQGRTSWSLPWTWQRSQACCRCRPKPWKASGSCPSARLGHWTSFRWVSSHRRRCCGDSWPLGSWLSLRWVSTLQWRPRRMELFCFLGHWQWFPLCHFARLQHRSRLFRGRFRLLCLKLCCSFGLLWEIILLLRVGEYLTVV